MDISQETANDVTTDVYTMTAPKQRETDSANAAAAGNKIFGLTAEKVIAFNVTDEQLEEYGLKDPYSKVTVDYADVYKRQAHIKDVCDLVKITHVYDRVIKNLSKGYKQRVGLAQALLGNPPLLILDEPTVGLDPKQIIEIRNLIRSLGKKHTVILSSHELSEVQATCDRVIVINNGQIVADDTEENLSKNLTGEHRLLARIEGREQYVMNLLRSIEGMNKVTKHGQKEEGVYEYVLEACLLYTSLQRCPPGIMRAANVFWDC